MITNFYPINFDFDEYQVLRVKAEPELLKKLREKHNSTHSFFKHGDFIYISNKHGEDLNIGKTETMSVYENSKITSSLIKHIFFRTFLELYPNYKPNSFYPFVFQSKKNENDLIHKYLPKSLKGRLSYLKQIEVQLRISLIDGNQQFGFLVNVNRNWKLDITCKELVEEGFNLINYEVSHSEVIPEAQNVLLPNESLVGTVTRIKNNIAIVESNEGEQSFKLDELYLRKTHKNIKDLLGFALQSSDKAEYVLSKLKIERAGSIIPKRILSDFHSAAKLLFFDGDGKSLSFENKDGFCFTISSPKNLAYKNYVLEPPTFVFDPSRTRLESRADYGLRKYGPYDSSQFMPKTPKLLVICHKENRGKMAEFLKELIDGMPSSKYFTKGFHSKYELHSVEYNIYEISTYEFEQIQKITSKITAKPDIVILEIPSHLKKVKEINKSLYYQTKAHFLNLQIPIQIVNSENIKKYDEYKLNAIGLQMYAKLGGVPWTILTKESIDREIIIGIGNSIFRNNTFKGNEQERIVGISTFFSGDGQYMMSGNIKDVPYDDYFQELLDSLKESIETLSKEYGWRDNDTVRLIFHIFKPIKDVEFKVVKELVSNISKYKIQFAFVTLSDFHPFLMFDETQKGITKYGKTIGEYVPYRGANIVLNNYSCLVQMLGVNEMKTIKHGASHPLLIKILKPTYLDDEDKLKELLFSDLHYITQQIFKFSYLSWRSFMPNQKPATMQYSNLIAKILGRLRMIPGWKSEVINFNLKYKKWFL